MSVRFRRSVRLFPGVRLNFSGSGISTTVGVRGASVNLGARGSYLNLGVPGSGVSARMRLSPSGQSAPRAQSVPPVSGGASAPAPAPPSHGAYSAPGLASIDYESADVSALTSRGLGELKRLINEAAYRRAALKIEVTTKQKRFDSAHFWLNVSRAFIIRVFTGKLVPGLAEKAQARLDELEETKAQLEGCHVEVDFGLDDEALNSYAALVRTFEALRCCEAIWDITSSHAVDRVAERTTATEAITRKSIGFSFVIPEIVRSEHQVMQLGNVTGKDIQLYPGFVMMRGKGGDFALIEYGNADLSYRDSRFIELGSVPSDSQVIGHTWLKANKDGSRDRRFNDNRQIPIALYGQLLFQSREGLFEAYQFSNAGKADAFARAYLKHQTALASLARRGNGAEPAAGPEAETVDLAEGGDQVETRPLINASPPKSLVADWIGLCALLGAIGAGAVWLDTHAGPLFTVMERQPAARASSVASVTSATSKPHRAHRKHRAHAAQHSAAAAVVAR